MGAVIFDTVVDWLGLIFCPIEIICGVVLVACSYKWLLPLWRDRKVPDYCCLFQSVFLCVSFFSVGIGGFYRFFSGKMDGVEVIARIAIKTVVIVVLLMTSTMLSVFEIKRWIGRNRTRG